MSPDSHCSGWRAFPWVSVVSDIKSWQGHKHLLCFTHKNWSRFVPPFDLSIHTAEDTPTLNTDRGWQLLPTIRTWSIWEPVRVDHLRSYYFSYIYIFHIISFLSFIPFILFYVISINFISLGSDCVFLCISLLPLVLSLLRSSSRPFHLAPLPLPPPSGISHLTTYSDIFSHFSPTSQSVSVY